MESPLKLVSRRAVSRTRLKPPVAARGVKIESGHGVLLGRDRAIWTEDRRDIERCLLLILRASRLALSSNGRYLQAALT
jgi:hypothetical protein